MKQHLLIAILCIFTFGSYSQNQLVLNGKVDGKRQGTIYLYNWTGVKPVKIDSITISEGWFSFNKTLPLPAVYVLTLEKSHQPIFLFPETEPMNVSLQVDSVTGKMNGYTVSGGKAQSAYNNYARTYRDHYNDYLKLVEDYDKAKGDKNEAAMKSQNEKMMAKEKAMSDLELKMIDDNPGNMLSLFFLCNRYRKSDVDKVREKLAKVDSHLQSSELYKHLNK
jgi:hypothetical protein